MSDKIKKLKALRNTEINRMSELKRVADVALTDYNIHSEFRQRYKVLEEIVVNFGKHQLNIISSLSSSDDVTSEMLADEETVRTEFEKELFTVQAIYSDLFEDLTKQSISINNNTPNTPTAPRAKLPEMKLPTFNGDVKSFTSFIDLYNVLVHNNASLSNIEKFSYLHSVLEGEPRSVIACTPLRENTYMIAYNALIKRYSNPRIEANAYWQEIESSPHMSVENPTQLRKLIDIFEENVAALEALNYPTKHWDFILCNMLKKRLDPLTESRYELELNVKSIMNPVFSHMIDFLTNHCKAYEASSLAIIRSKHKNFRTNRDQRPSSSRNSSSFIANTQVSGNRYCPLCKSEHALHKCSSFLDKSPKERYNIVKQNKWCTNCLSHTHSKKKCSSSNTCRYCQSAFHHSTLHFEKPLSNIESHNLNESASRNIASSSNISNPDSGPAVLTTNLDQHSVLLATVQLRILDFRGNLHVVRALVDSGSQANFISKQCVNRLGSKVFKSSISVFGIGNMTTQASLGAVNCTIQPLSSSQPSLTLEFIVLENISSNMPTFSIDPSSWNYIENINLADPHFFNPAQIDLLLGADVFQRILLDGRIRGDENLPTALNTSFGWILFGKVGEVQQKNVNSFLNIVEMARLENAIKKFWELEEIPNKPIISEEDKMCEDIFLKTTIRTDTGRFMVSLPFKETSNLKFENSREIALRRFFSLENRLHRETDLCVEYSKIFSEYIESGYMEKIPDSELNAFPSYYIPHTCVFKPDSSTSKVRVVFDASTKCSNNFSLNDVLMKGPKLQKNISAILLNFRLHAIAFTSDISRMYLRILINPANRDFQRLFWRFTPQEPLIEYRLCTVTFGVVSSPWLALRTLAQLANDESLRFPLASRILLSDSIYVDDVIGGCNSLDEALEIQRQLIELCRKGGFHLKKWSSNNIVFLQNLPEGYSYNESYLLDKETESTIKVLGLKWTPSLDTFSYTINAVEAKINKRNILSEIGRIFDPLGFLSPVTLCAKLIMKQLWMQGIDWDDRPPQSIVDNWVQFKTQLPNLSLIAIPRFIQLVNFMRCELHAFCDGSQNAYASCLYVRVIKNDNISVSLLSAKSKVTPTKPLSIPKIELSAAYLLSKLVAFVLETYSTKIKFDQVYAWTDSSIVLHWMKSDPNKYKTFVANRISMIQENISPNCWRHVTSEDNPADCASRSLLPKDLVDHPLWWTGPPWLCKPESEWPLQKFKICIDDQEERKSTLIAFTEANFLEEILNRFSSLDKIKRILAYAKRFIYNLKNPLKKVVGHSFSEVELQEVLVVLVNFTQSSVFANEISQLKTNKPLPKYMRKLSAFIDEHGSLRVGGRLNNSLLNYDKKHPLLLPSSSRLTDLIIEHTHKMNLHPGLQTLHFLLLQNFWILSPRRTISKVLSKCFQCWRLKPRCLQPPMGDLPATRVSQVKPFSVIAVDFCGPFNITLVRIRGARTFKYYICVFICFATKAVHLEMISDMTTEAFLAGLRRFMARRGRCSHVFSDCGRNFVGANKYILEIMKNVTESEKIIWSFHPPTGSHFSGLVEAGVKSFKTHLARVIGSQILTFEELHTLVIQIEALLNSRPLYPLSTDPNDLSVLTPGHFLTKEPLTCLPDYDLKHLKLNCLSRWQLLQRMHADFWARWHQEYLSTLQQKNKWTSPDSPLRVGDLVLVKQDDMPPLQWRTARVLNLYPGLDGVSRVATVKTNSGIYRRPVNKLCPLTTA